MVELVDAADSKSADFTVLRVQVSLPVPYNNYALIFRYKRFFIVYNSAYIAKISSGFADITIRLNRFVLSKIMKNSSKKHLTVFIINVIFYQYHAGKIQRGSSMRKLDYDHDLVRSKNKTKSFFIYSFMVLALAAIGGGIYYAIFTPDYLAKESTRQTTATNSNPQLVPVSDIPTILDNENLAANNQVTGQGTQSFGDEPARNLPVSDMNKNQAPASQAIPPATTTNDFEITPPSGSSASIEFSIPTEDELKQKREQAKANQLEMLQKARQVKLAENQKKILPGANNQLSLSNQKATNTKQDPIITNVFVQKLANLLVDNYNKNKKDSSLNAIKASQHFGVTMQGLLHPNGRQGVLKYAYHPRMIQTLSEFIGPNLISEMSYTAKSQGFNAKQKQEMFHYYAARVTNTAVILGAILNTKELDKQIPNYIEIEQKLKKKKEEFAQTLIDFEITKQKKQGTKRLEAKLGKISREANAIEVKLQASHNRIISSISKNAPNLSKQKELLGLALWVNRRNDRNASLAAVQALYKFSSLLSTK